jgi:hypothetical protein
MHWFAQRRRLLEFADKIFHRPDKHPEPRSLLNGGVLAHAKTACSHSHQKMSFGACATRDLGAALGRAGAARGGDGGGICAGSERNADLVKNGTWHVRFCKLTVDAGFPSPYYSEAHSGQARKRSSGARASSRGAPRVRSGDARARCEGAMRTGAFQGDGDEGQTICNYGSMNSARCRGSGILAPHTRSERERTKDLSSGKNMRKIHTIWYVIIPCPKMV